MFVYGWVRVGGLGVDRMAVEWVAARVGLMRFRCHIFGTGKEGLA